MNGHTNWLFIIVIFFSFLGFLTAGILFFVNRNQSIAPRILALVVFGISYSLLGYALYLSEEFLNFPHLWRTPAFFTLCIAPLTYIYVRSVLEQAYRLRKWDLLFFLPPLIYTAQLIPFYMLPASAKIPYITQAIKSKAFGLRESEGLLPPGVAFFFRMTYNFGILGYTFFMLRRWKNSERGELLKIRENQPIYSWLMYLTILLILCFASLIIGSLLYLVTDQFDKVRISSITVTLTICFICTYLYVRPELLYGFRGWAPIPDKPAIDLQEEETPEANAAQSKKVTISIEQGKLFKELVDRHFEDSKPFTKPRYSIKDMSAELGIPSYLLSSFINQEYGKNFNEFVNDSRVEYLMDLVKREPGHLEYTLEVLGQLGGFNSRSAFIEAVKRKTGAMPSVIFQKSGTD